MNKILSAVLACLAVSCSTAATTDMPQWRWEDPVVPDGPEIVEEHPAIVELGWTNVSALYPALPEGLAIYKSPAEAGGQKVIAYIAVADLKKLSWDVCSIDDPSLSGTSDALKTPAEYFRETAAPVILNGGYFFSEGGKNYNASVAVSASRTYGVNINYASMDWVTMYYPTRGVFYEKDGKLSAGWTYWTGGAKHYLYDTPAKNAWQNDPLPVPDATFPSEAQDFLPETAIGAGPVLIKGAEVVNTWEAELLYGDGADDKMPRDRHPRSAIGVTADGFLILFVCEGRGMTEGVSGMSFAEEADVMKALGCVEALNLDGGGSSCLLVQGQETIKVSDRAQRPVGSVVIVKAR